MAPGSEQQQQDRPTMRPRTALVVEDEPAMGDILAEILRARGYEPVVLTCGAPAVEFVRRRQPDLVLLDLMLPDGDGRDICRELKLERETNLVPVIMVTALDGREDVIRGLRVGANFYLTKPFDVDQLYDAIDQVTRRRSELQRQGTRGEVRFEIHSDLRYLEELNRLLASLFLHTGLSEDEVHRLTTAVREMGVNAIEWGHRKQVERVVTVTYRIEADRIEIVIRDTGPGFDRCKLPHAAKEEDPVGHMAVREQLGLRAGGFGILLSKGLVDELAYNECGNEVRLVKRLAPRPADNPAPD